MRPGMRIRPEVKNSSLWNLWKKTSEAYQWLTGPQVGADTCAVQVKRGYHGGDKVTKSSIVSNLGTLFRNGQAEVFFWFYSGHADEDFRDEEEEKYQKDLKGVLPLNLPDLHDKDELTFDDVIKYFTEAMDQQGGCMQRKEADHMSQQLRVWALGEKAQS